MKPTRNDVLNIRFIEPKVKKDIERYCKRTDTSYGKWAKEAHEALVNKK